MKKLFVLLAVFAMLFAGASFAVAQDTIVEEGSGQVDTVAIATTPLPGPSVAVSTEGGLSVLHKNIKQKFIEGGASFMGAILLVLILGLALAFERIIYLNLATTNTDKLLQRVEDALDTGGVEAAKEVCRNTRGPVASIFYQGLDRVDHGIDVVEKFPMEVFKWDYWKRD
jgi:biopolymer transport protein ExbB